MISWRATPRRRTRCRWSYNGVDHVDGHVPDATTEEFLRALALPQRFVLYAGSLDVRKNVSLVLDALERLKARGRPVSLVMVGQSWFGSGAVESRVARMRSEGHDIRPLGYQSEPVFFELMRRAAVFVFPSKYEGFGLPPLEAMRLGTPAIVSTTGAHAGGVRRGGSGGAAGRRRGAGGGDGPADALGRGAAALGGGGPEAGGPVHLGALRGADARGLRGGTTAVRSARESIGFSRSFCEFWVPADVCMREAGPLARPPPLNHTKCGRANQ